MAMAAKPERAQMVEIAIGIACFVWAIEPSPNLGIVPGMWREAIRRRAWEIGGFCRHCGECAKKRPVGWWCCLRDLEDRARHDKWLGHAYAQHVAVANGIAAWATVAKMTPAELTAFRQRNDREAAMLAVFSASGAAINRWDGFPSMDYDDEWKNDRVWWETAVRFGEAAKAFLALADERGWWPWFNERGERDD